MYNRISVLQRPPELVQRWYSTSYRWKWKLEVLLTPSLPQFFPLFGNNITALYSDPCPSKAKFHTHFTLCNTALRGCLQFRILILAW